MRRNDKENSFTWIENIKLIFSMIRTDMKFFVAKSQLKNKLTRIQVSMIYYDEGLGGVPNA